MKTWVHRYELETKQNLRRMGALLKIEWASARFGFSDVHPWPEFGDQPLELQLERLTQDALTPLLEVSLNFNRMDCEYRRLNRSAFLGLPLPTSHKLIVDLLTTTEADLHAWQAQGFTHLKVKLGQSLQLESGRLQQLMRASNFIWRLDMNGRLKATEFITWWCEFPKDLRVKIDFVEDPVGDSELPLDGPWADDWRRLSNSVVEVIKPARQLHVPILQNKRVVFTNSFEHSLGQACAIWTAAQHYRSQPHTQEVCGLGAPEHYKQNKFTQEWSCSGPILRPPPGAGFGFDSGLKELLWERLV